MTSANDTAKDRVVVYHHGLEAKGTVHRCQVESPLGDPHGGARGDCVCMCKDDHAKANALHPDSHLSDEEEHEQAERDYKPRIYAHPPPSTRPHRPQLTHTVPSSSNILFKRQTPQKNIPFAIPKY
jgi:hypothetical protein